MFNALPRSNLFVFLTPGCDSFLLPLAGGHAAVVAVLLQAGADCDVQNSNGNTPLHLSSGKGWVEVAERLAAAGANTCIKNSKGWLAIQVMQRSCGALHNILIHPKRPCLLLASQLKANRHLLSSQPPVWFHC